MCNTGQNTRNNIFSWRMKVEKTFQTTNMRVHIIEREFI